MRAAISLVSALLASGAAGQAPYREPDLSAIELPILEASLQQPELLWQFLIDPATPFDQALAAADRCGPVFSFALARQLLVANAQLERERQQHGFGFDPPAEWSQPLALPNMHTEVEAPRERTLLGRPWTPPATRGPYPHTWELAAAAPWPWRVHTVLVRAWIALGHSINRPVGDIDPWWRRIESWYAECARWPIATDDDALVYFDATRLPTHGKTTAVLARWRRILLDANTPQAATRIAHALGEVHRLLLYGDGDARAACEVLLGDGLNASPHEQARQGCAYQLRGFLTYRDRQMKEHTMACPPEAVLAAGDLGTLPCADDVSARWTQLYVYGFSVCETVNDAPISVERSVGMDQQDVPKQLGDFATWWAAHRAEVVRAVDRRSADLQRLRARLDELAR